VKSVVYKFFIIKSGYNLFILIAESTKLCYHRIMKYFSPEQLLSWDNDFDFFISPVTQSDDLLKNQLYAPFPVAGQKLVWGFQFVKRALHLGIKQVVCRDFSEAGIIELLRLALLLENRKGSYSWREKEKIVLFCEKHNIDALSDDIIVLIENHSDEEFFKRIKYYIKYPDALKSLLDKKFVDAKTGERISKLPRSFFQKLLKNESRFTYAERRIFCHYVSEIIKRDKLKSAQREKFIKTIFSQDKPLKEVRKLRYPTLTGLEKRLANFKEQYLKGSGVALHEPPYFEGNAFRLSFSFENKQQYEKKVTRLIRLKQNIHELIRLLH
jgi:hypothetical protein